MRVREACKCQNFSERFEGRLLHLTVLTVASLRPYTCKVVGLTRVTRPPYTCNNSNDANASC